MKRPVDEGARQRGDNARDISARATLDPGKNDVLCEFFSYVQRVAANRTCQKRLVSPSGKRTAGAEIENDRDDFHSGVTRRLNARFERRTVPEITNHDSVRQHFLHEVRLDEGRVITLPLPTVRTCAAPPAPAGYRDTPRESCHRRRSSRRHQAGARDRSPG